MTEGADFSEHYKRLADQKRLWMLIPQSKDAYIPGFEGTFNEALIEAAAHSAFWKTATSVYEANPEKYRREGGLKELWAVVRVPEGSPLREKG